MYKLALMNQFIKKIDKIHPKGTRITTDELMAAAREAIEAQDQREDVLPIKKIKKKIDLDEFTFGDDRQSDVSISVEPMHLLDTATDQEYLTDKESNKVKRTFKLPLKQRVRQTE